jgi:hypothetical protein
MDIKNERQELINEAKRCELRVRTASAICHYIKVLDLPEGFGDRSLDDIFQYFLLEEFNAKKKLQEHQQKHCEVTVSHPLDSEMLVFPRTQNDHIRDNLIANDEWHTNLCNHDSTGELSLEQIQETALRYKVPNVFFNGVYYWYEPGSGWAQGKRLPE